jgi:hypothetical protein
MRDRQTLNDSERAQWIANDESLYNWQRSSRLSMRAFIRENRSELDAYINKALNKESR